MRGDKEAASFAALFFPEAHGNTYALYVSSPPPIWLCGNDLTKVVIEKTGMYCLFFLVKSKAGGSACITVNGREIRGSFTMEKYGEISGSAVCSIRELALPCSLEIKTENGAGAGILVVAECDV